MLDHCAVLRVVLGTSVWAGLIGAVLLIAGCSAPMLSAPVLRTPSFVDAPAYDSPAARTLVDLTRSRYLVATLVVLQGSVEVTGDPLVGRRLAMDRAGHGVVVVLSLAGEPCT